MEVIDYFWRWFVHWRSDKSESLASPNNNKSVCACSTALDNADMKNKCLCMCGQVITMFVFLKVWQTQRKALCWMCHSRMGLLWPCFTSLTKTQMNFPTTKTHRGRNSWGKEMKCQQLNSFACSSSHFSYHHIHRRQEPVQILSCFCLFFVCADTPYRVHTRIDELM